VEINNNLLSNLLPYTESAFSNNSTQNKDIQLNQWNNEQSSTANSDGSVDLNPTDTDGFVAQFPSSSIIVDPKN
jgi:hypothetical protein